MRNRAKRELSRNWPILGIAVVMWLAVVVLRTPALGIDLVRVTSIIIASGAMLTIGMTIERIRSGADQEDKP